MCVTNGTYIKLRFYDDTHLKIGCGQTILLLCSTKGDFVFMKLLRNYLMLVSKYNSTNNLKVLS